MKHQEKNAGKNLTFVILGGTGDLAKNKLLPVLNNIVKRKVVETINIVSTGRRNFSPKEYEKHIGMDGLDPKIKLHYFQADFTHEGSLKGFKDFFKTFEDKNTIGKVFYLATSPKFFETITHQISDCCNEDKSFIRLMIEKPFGYDLESSRKLNKSITKFFNEDQLFRVDHYLGKETVQNILVLRLSNPFFEKTWNSQFIEKIEIIVDENIGVGDRLAYYDTAGAIRDMIQNHLLQMAAFVLMEVPKDESATEIHNAKAQALKDLFFDGHLQIGQYDEYVSELIKAGLGDHSNTETYASVELLSKSKRWQDTKIILKTGKMLDKREAKIIIHYKKEPCTVYCDTRTEPNKLVLNVQPYQDIEFFMNIKTPHKNTIELDADPNDIKITNIKMNFCRDCAFSSDSRESYEVIIEECINNNKTLFISEDELEAAWKIVDDIRSKIHNIKPTIYKKGISSI